MQAAEARLAAKFAGPVRTVLKVFHCAGIVALVLAVLMAVFTVLGPDRYFAPERFASSSFTFELNGLVRYRVDTAKIDPARGVREVFQGIAAAAIVYLLFFIFIVLRLRQVMDTVASGNPFHPGNPKRVRDIGAAVIAGGFIFPAANSWVAVKMISTFSLAGFSVTYSPDVELAFIGFLLTVLAAVFAYGCYLQQEMDQTV